MSRPLLEVDQVTRRFGGVTAVDRVSLMVAEGEILGLMGANGAGKTTLFAMIAGNLRPSAGQIRLDGAMIQGQGAARVNRLGVARTFQIVRPFAQLSVLDNVAIAALYGRGRTQSLDQARDQAARILESLGLAARARDSAATLTLAGRKRLEIARALATRPRLLLLDEVMAGLTAAEVADGLRLVRQLRDQQGLTVIVIEHVMRALMSLSDRIVVLHHGQRIAEGTPAQIARNSDVAAVYFGSAAATQPAHGAA